MLLAESLNDCSSERQIIRWHSSCHIFRLISYKSYDFTRMGILNKKGSKLQFKLTLQFALFFVAVAAIIFFYFSKKFEEETLEHFRFKARVIQSFLEQNPETFWNKECVVKDKLKELMKLNDAYYLVIEDKEGAVIDAINVNYAESNFYVTTKTSEGISPDKSVYRVKAPITAREMLIGRVFIGFKSKLIATELERKTLLTALFSICILLSGIVFTYFLSAVSFRPITKLISQLDQTSSGDIYSELKNSKKNEIDILTEKVGAVVAELDQSSMQVEKMKKKLSNVFHERIIEIDNEIIQRKTAEKYLKKSEQQFKLLFENAPIGMVLTSINGIIINVNNTFCNTLGFRFEEIVGKPIKNIFTDNNSFQYKPLINIIRENATVDSEAILVRKDGSNIFAIVKSVGISDDKGNPTHSLIQILDITDIRKAQTELTIALEKAKESDRLKSAFLAQMSHEIRTPLNVILPSIPIIGAELGNKDDEMREILRSVENAGKRLHRTIDMILSMSAVQSGNYKPDYTTFNIVEELKVLTSEFKSLAEEKRLKLLFQNTSSNSEVIADKYTVIQIFQNLLGNAVKYTNKGYIKVSVEDSGEGKIVVHVEDSGIGISSKYLNHLFTPFSQEDVGQKRKYEGNGLGLALVKEYVDLNKGTITVQSQKNRGSIFSVILEKNHTPVLVGGQDPAINI